MLSRVGKRPGFSARLLRLLERFGRSERGAGAIEFALVAAPFLALLIALLQTALVFFAGRVLEEVVSESSRYIMTGQAQQSNMTKSGFANYLCTGSDTAGLVSALFTCSKFNINVQNYDSFASASTSTQSVAGFNAQGQALDSRGNVINWSWSPGDAGDIVVVQVIYPWPIVLGPLGFNLSNVTNGTRMLVATAVFKNEPY